MAAAFISATIHNYAPAIMNPIDLQEKVPVRLECPSCGSGDVSSSIEEDTFQYGDGPNAVTLSVSVLAHHCAACGLSCTRDDAEELRHNAICRHLGVLTPNEIKSIRERYRLSQAEFAELTKIGKASLARWEGGLLIQNSSSDNFLYLLTFEDNAKRLRERNSTPPTQTERPPKKSNVIPFFPRFKCIDPDEVERKRVEGSNFDLFPAVACGRP